MVDPKISLSDGTEITFDDFDDCVRVFNVGETVGAEIPLDQWPAIRAFVDNMIELRG